MQIKQILNKTLRVGTRLHVNMLCSKRFLKKKHQYTSLNVFMHVVYVVKPLLTKAVTQRCSVRKGVLRNFEKFTGKHRKALWHRCFPVNLRNF